MKTFDVLLTRSYRVRIDAADKRVAMNLSEFYIGGERDLSNEENRLEHRFRIHGIEMLINEAFEVEESVNEEYEQIIAR